MIFQGSEGNVTVVVGKETRIRIDFHSWKSKPLFLNTHRAALHRIITVYDAIRNDGVGEDQTSVLSWGRVQMELTYQHGDNMLVIEAWDAVSPAQCHRIILDQKQHELFLAELRVLAE